MNAPPDAPHPLLEAAPGMTMAEAAAASTVKLAVPPPSVDPCLAQPHDPHRFRLRSERAGFDVPAGRFSVLEGHRGVVFRLRATPQLDYLGLEAAIDLASSLEATIAAAGWKPRERRSRAELLQNLRTAAEDRASSWLYDEWVAEIRIRRVVDAATAAGQLLGLAEDGHLVTLIVWDIRRAALAGGPS